MGLFDKLKQGLKKTAQLLNTDVRDLFKAEGRLIDDAFLDELLEILIKTDMGVKAAGGVRDLEGLKAMVAAGASRIGASAGVKIVRQAKGDSETESPSAGRY